ncbi:MAG: hypothetical protein MHM6MM_008744 [Cercozoa sp. M6MM]
MGFIKRLVERLSSRASRVANPDWVNEAGVNASRVVGKDEIGNVFFEANISGVWRRLVKGRHESIATPQVHPLWNNWLQRKGPAPTAEQIARYDRQEQTRFARGRQWEREQRELDEKHGFLTDSTRFTEAKDASFSQAPIGVAETMSALLQQQKKQQAQADAETETKTAGDEERRKPGPE